MSSSHDNTNSVLHEDSSPEHDNSNIIKPSQLMEEHITSVSTAELLSSPTNNPENTVIPHDHDESEQDSDSDYIFIPLPGQFAVNASLDEVNDDTTQNDNDADHHAQENSQDEEHEEDSQGQEDDPHVPLDESPSNSEQIPDEVHIDVTPVSTVDVSLEPSPSQDIPKTESSEQVSKIPVFMPQRRPKNVPTGVIHYPSLDDSHEDMALPKQDELSQDTLHNQDVDADVDPDNASIIPAITIATTITSADTDDMSTITTTTTSTSRGDESGSSNIDKSMEEPPEAPVLYDYTGLSNLPGDSDMGDAADEYDNNIVCWNDEEDAFGGEYELVELFRSLDTTPTAPKTTDGVEPECNATDELEKQVLQEVARQMKNYTPSQKEELQMKQELAKQAIEKQKEACRASKTSHVAPAAFVIDNTQEIINELGDLDKYNAEIKRFSPRVQTVYRKRQEKMVIRAPADDQESPHGADHQQGTGDEHAQRPIIEYHYHYDVHCHYTIYPRPLPHAIMHPAMCPAIRPPSPDTNGVYLARKSLEEYIGDSPSHPEDPNYKHDIDKHLRGIYCLPDDADPLEDDYIMPYGPSNFRANDNWELKHQGGSYPQHLYIRSPTDPSHSTSGSNSPSDPAPASDTTSAETEENKDMPYHCHRRRRHCHGGSGSALHPRRRRSPKPSRMSHRRRGSGRLSPYGYFQSPFE